MGASLKRVLLPFLLLLAISASASADEIRLKDGKKLYGVIVAYEDNMFKVKTDFGFVLVEKDKIAAIIPAKASGPAPAADPKPATPAAEPAAKKTTDSPAESAAAAKTAPLHKEKRAEPAASASAPAPAPASTPKPPEPVNRDEVQGNEYINFTYNFRMYKPPSWDLIEDARKALPTAVAAMGTPNETTLLVVGHEKLNQPLDSAAAIVEKRLHDIYEDYRLVSRQKTTLSGQPGVQYKFRGKADEHDWSGTLVVVSRSDETYTLLGMTYADSDLIQIQENVIARAIASLQFTAH